MKKIFFILTLILIPFRVFASDICGDYIPSPEIKFMTSYGRLTYNRSKSKQELTKIGKEYGIVEQGLFASGLALVSVIYRVSANTVRKKNRAGTYCVMPVDVEVFVGYQDPEILLSRELKEGSCEYNVVLRHEQTHQQINTAALRYFLPKLKESIEAIVRNTPPIEIRNKNDSEKATQDLINAYMRQLSPLIEFFKKELLREQKKLDNHKNYQMEGNLCRRYHEEHD